MLAVVLTGWYAGFIIAAVVIVLVVILVAILLTLARRIARQAAAIEEALDQSRWNTEPLWDLAMVNDAVGDIIEHASVLRRSLEDA
ncbi:MAG: hypothetical protein M3527_03270 [Actinomycetota bacterium]|nr:hypothetical protein [Acidimicrobiia bacterium]MDQ3293459.1 hypothetical protein [Actinomycetota bacterium]